MKTSSHRRAREILPQNHADSIREESSGGFTESDRDVYEIVPTPEKLDPSGIT